MRILHVIATMDPAAGGPSESVRTLLSFGALGYEGEVVTLDDPKAIFLKALPFPVHALGPRRSEYGLTLRLLPWLRRNCSRFDGVIVNGLWNICGLATLLALGRRKPYMVFPHGMLDPYFRRAFPLKHLKKWAYWSLAEYWVLRRAHRVLFTTEEESILACQSFCLHRWKGHVVPYGSSRPPATVEHLRESYFLAFPEMRGRRFMLFLGRIHRKKGCDLLIHAFLRLAAQDPELHLVVAGPDQQGWTAELQQLVADAGLNARVHWPGMLIGEQKWGILAACEVFILPSHQENFGIAVAEALSCGKAALLADKVNIAPAIQQDGAGFMAPDTQAGTDQLIERWMALPSEAKAAMGDTALQTFHRRFDMERNAATILWLFASLAASAKALAPTEIAPGTSLTR